MSPWLFNIFFDRAGRQVNDRAIGRGVKLIYENGGVRNKEVLYAEDTFW